MRVKRIFLKIRSLDEMAEDFKRTWKKAMRGRTMRESAETICFDSVEDMQKFLSPERIRLLKAVHEKQPKSIYELAKRLHRDRKNVSEDVKLLVSIGLVERKTSKKDKKRAELVVDYDRIQMDIAV